MSWRWPRQQLWTSGQNLARRYSSLVRKAAPDFSAKALVQGEFKTIKRDELLEITAFNDRIEEFHQIGCKVLAASIDSEYAHLAWTNLARAQGGLGPTRLPLLSDVSKRLATDYGVLLGDSGVALRGLFIVDKQGIVRHSTVNDLGIGRSVDETLRLVKAIQFNDEHGEVCPANWKPGGPSIKATPKDAKQFFEQNSR